MHVKKIILAASLLTSIGSVWAQDAMKKDPSPTEGSSMQHADKGMAKDAMKKDSTSTNESSMQHTDKGMAKDGAMNHGGAMGSEMKMKEHKKSMDREKAGTPSARVSDACDHRMRACES